MTNNLPNDCLQNPDVTVRARGRVQTLDYAGLEVFHQGDSWWGCTVGFRALQRVANELNKANVLDRDNLTIVSGHPGPGVLDAIEYVTGCVSTKRFCLLEAVATDDSCSRAMTFQWWVSDGRQTVHIKLREDFVPDAFYQVLDRLGTNEEQPADKQDFTAYKSNLSQQLWHTPLDEAFHVTVQEKPLAPGELPNA